MTIGKRLAMALSMVLALAGVGVAQNSEFPSRPLRVIVPFAAGGTLDVAARVISDQLSQQLGHGVIVDNRGGANGIIGTDAVAKAAPDGHTLLMVTASFVINPQVYRKLPYDAVRDFAPVTELGRGTGYLLLVPAALPVKSVQELVDASRAPKAEWNYASPGVGNTLHLATEIFKLKTGGRFTHVAYRGIAPAVNALIAGEVQMAFMPPIASLEYVKSGMLRALAFTGARRSDELPDVPTMTEAGFSSLTMEGAWLGLFAPAATPRPVIERLQAETHKALTTPKIAHTLRQGGYEPMGSAPDVFAAFVKDEFQRYGQLIKDARIEPQ